MKTSFIKLSALTKFLSTVALERITRSFFSFLILYLISQKHGPNYLADYHLIIYFFAIITSLGNLGLGDFIGKIFSADLEKRNGLIEAFISLKIGIGILTTIICIFYYSNLFYSFFFISIIFIGITDFIEVDFRKKKPEGIHVIGYIKIKNFIIFGLIKVLTLSFLNFNTFLSIFLIEAITLLIIYRKQLQINSIIFLTKPNYLLGTNFYSISLIGILSPIKSKIEFLFLGEQKLELAQFGILIQIFTIFELSIYVLKNYLQQKIHIQKINLSKSKILSYAFSIWFLSFPVLFVIFAILKIAFPDYSNNIEYMIPILYFRFLAGILGMTREIFYVEEYKSNLLLKGTAVSFVVLLIINLIAVKNMAYSALTALCIQTLVLFFELTIMELLYNRSYISDNIKGIIDTPKTIKYILKEIKKVYARPIE